jgi:hypothetical protein
VSSTKILKELYFYCLKFRFLNATIPSKDGIAPKNKQFLPYKCYTTPKNKTMNKKDITAVVGFLLLLFGMLALVLSLVGAQLSFLTFIDAQGRLLGFVIRLLMIMLGIVMMILSRTNWREQE